MIQENEDLGHHVTKCGKKGWYIILTYGLAKCAYASYQLDLHHTG